MKQKIILIMKISLIAIPLFFILNTWAKTINTSSSGHGHGASSEATTKEDRMVHSEVVTSDEEFINQMIPHHQEAIDTSNIVLEKSNNANLKQFASGVVRVQTSEINQMKEWYTSWFDKEYTSNSNYTAMMGNLTQLSNEELEKEYITGMIAHHRGAIDMAKQILPITDRPEIKKMAEDIINVQTKEITLLQNLLEGYDHEESEH